MKLNIDSLYDKKKDYIEFDLSENISKISICGIDHSLVSPLHLFGKVYRVGKNLMLNAEVDFVYKTNCSRCLVDLNQDINYHIEAYLMNEDYDEANYEDCDVFSLSSTDVDLLEIVEGTLIFQVPQKILCSENCKGICSGCGVDLNTEICKCEDSIDVEDDIDPRLVKLKELLK